MFIYEEIIYEESLFIYEEIEAQRANDMVKVIPFGKWQKFNFFVTALFRYNPHNSIINLFKKGTVQ